MLQKGDPFFTLLLGQSVRRTASRVFAALRVGTGISGCRNSVDMAQLFGYMPFRSAMICAVITSSQAAGRTLEMQILIEDNSSLQCSLLRDGFRSVATGATHLDLETLERRRARHEDGSLKSQRGQALVATDDYYSMKAQREVLSRQGHSEDPMTPMTRKSFFLQSANVLLLLFIIGSLIEFYFIFQLCDARSKKSPEFELRAELNDAKLELLNALAKLEGRDEEIRRLQIQLNVTSYSTVVKSRRNTRIFGPEEDEGPPEPADGHNMTHSDNVNDSSAQFNTSNLKATTPSRNRMLRVVAVEPADQNVVHVKSTFPPITQDDIDISGDDDNEYHTAMARIKLKLAEDLDSVNLKLASQIAVMASQLSSPEERNYLQYDVLKSRQPSAEDESTSADYTGFSSSTRGFASTPDPSIDPTESLRNFVMEDDLEEDDGWSFRPLTLFAMSALSNRDSATSSSSSATTVISDQSCEGGGSPVEILRLTDEFDSKVKDLILARRDALSATLLDHARQKIADLNKQLELYLIKNSAGCASRKTAGRRPV